MLAIQETVADIVQFEGSYSSRVGPPLNRCVVVPFDTLAVRNGPSKSDMFEITVAVYEKFVENIVNRATNGGIHGIASIHQIFPIRTDQDAINATLEEMFEDGYELFRAQLQAKSTYGKTSIADIEARKVAVSALCQEVIGSLFAMPGLVSGHSDLNASSFY